MEKLREMIKKHEGFRDRIYLDSLGNITGGYGHFFWVGSKLPLSVCETLLDQDLSEAVNDFSKIGKKRIDLLNNTRRRVIINMIFNMGLQKVLSFKKMWQAIDIEDWETAANEMLDSKWAQQVKSRAVELSNIMKTGSDTGD